MPLSALPSGALAQVAGILTDIDDTLTAHGALDPAAGEALAALASAGVPVVAITGRPMGWSQPFAMDWPVAAIVAENGAVALMRDGQCLRTEYAQDERTREANAARLRRVAARVVAEVAGATLARDSPGRVTDIAVDHSEFAHLDEAAIARVVQLMQSEGMTATVSSIHINGWFGTPRQAQRGALDRAAPVRSRPRRGTWALGLCRRFHQRSAHVRPLPAQRWRGQPA